VTAARGRVSRCDRPGAAVELAGADGPPAAPGGSEGAFPGPVSTSPSTVIAPTTTTVSVADIAALCAHGLKVIRRLHEARS
jgi:hypothetical protein